MWESIAYHLKISNGSLLLSAFCRTQESTSNRSQPAKMSVNIIYKVQAAGTFCVGRSFLPLYLGASTFCTLTHTCVPSRAPKQSCEKTLIVYYYNSIIKFEGRSSGLVNEVGIEDQVDINYLNIRKEWVAIHNIFLYFFTRWLFHKVVLQVNHCNQNILENIY